MKNNYIKVLFSSLILIIIIGAVYSFMFSYDPTGTYYQFDSSWTVYYHGKIYYNVPLTNIDKQLATTFRRGDTITLKAHIPADLNYDTPTFLMSSNSARVKIDLAGRPIYDYGRDALIEDTLIGDGYLFVSLPDDYADKDITITINVNENDSTMNSINPIIGTYYSVSYMYISEVLFAAFVGIFLVTYGTVFTIVSLLFYSYSSTTITQLYCSIISLLLGVWTLGAYDISQLYMNQNLSVTFEYFALYLMLPFCYLLVGHLHKNMDLTVFKVTFAITTLFVAEFLLMHLFNVVHITHMLIPYYIICFVAYLQAVYIMYKDYKSHIKNASRTLLMIGLIVLLSSFVFYALSNVLRNIINYRINPFTKYLFPSCVLVFVVTQLLNYFVFLTESFAKKKEYAFLSHMAYEDSLTGLPNRARCDQLLSDIQNTELDYCILSLDLNGLKEVNDNDGHPAGDKLLKDFATILKECFADIGTSCRIGGDEFIVLAESADKDIIDNALFRLVEKLHDLDAREPSINHSAAYGYAFKHECEGKSTHDVYMLADARMYALKRKQHTYKGKISTI